MGDKKSKQRLISLLLVMMMLILTACAKEASQEISQKEEEAFIISGLIDADITVNAEKLKQLPAVTRDVVSVNASGEKKEFNVKGALLEDLLKEHEKSQKDLDAIRLIAGDGYSIEVPKEVLDNRDVVLAYEMDGEPLDQASRPVRAIIPEERAMYWVRNITEIEVLKKQIIQAGELHKLYFLESLVAQVHQQDYTYYESVDKAVKIQDLLGAIEESDINEGVYIKAADGLEKNEAKDVFVTGYMKISGKESPTFLSPDLPKGMHVKDILWFTCGKNAVFTIEEGFNVIGKDTLGDKPGMLMSKLMKEVGLAPTEKYLFTAEDGYALEVLGSDIEKGILYKNESGKLCTYFEGLPKNTSIKGIVSIEILK